MDSHLLFCIDPLALICAALVVILTPLALYFGSEYMFREPFINRLLYLLNLFAASVVLLFFCYDFFLIILAWEMIGLFSLLLVNFYSMRIYSIKAALKTFFLSRVSDMFLFTAFILSFLFFHTTDLSLIFFKIPFLSFHFIFINAIGFHFLSILAFVLALAGLIKSAQFFFHV
jgi:NADH-quinone oxidoreductase subunit L